MSSTVLKALPKNPKIPDFFFFFLWRLAANKTPDARGMTFAAVWTEMREVAGGAEAPSPDFALCVALAAFLLAFFPGLAPLGAELFELVVVDI